MSGEAFSESSAQDTQLAALEAKEWIEAVTGKKFKNDSIRESLEDGVLLCELMNKVNPGFIKKINKSKSPIAYLDNIRQFLNGCQDLGMKDAQLFDTMDLQDAKGGRKTGVKRNESDRRIRAVCITLFWLGRAVAELEEYSGPQLDLELFKRLMEGKLSDEEGGAVDEGVVVDRRIVRQPKYIGPVGSRDNHFSNDDEEARSPTPTAVSNDSITTGSSQENGLNLTFEQEQTADELLADIQNAVDEMLENFQFSPVSKKPPKSIPPKPAKKPNVKSNAKMVNGAPDTSSEPTGDQIDGDQNERDQKHVVKMRSRNGGFGFQIMGGVDSNIPAQVDYIVPGSAAEDSGLEVGDILSSVNGEDITELCHTDLVGAIKKAGSTGEVILGVRRSINSSDSTDPAHTEEPSHRQFSREESFDRWEEANKERMRQAEEIALLYPQRNGGVVDTGTSNGPPLSYSREPLETLVEHQEEAMLEQLEEIAKASSPPQHNEPLTSFQGKRSRSHTPPMNRSPFTPTSPIQDDRESIEREIQELELMAAKGNYPGENGLSDSTDEENEDDHGSNRQIPSTRKIVGDSGPVKFDSFEVMESRSPLPMSPIPQPVQLEVEQVGSQIPPPPLPPPLHPSDVPGTSKVVKDPVLSLEEQMDELIKLTTLTSTASQPRMVAAASPPPTTTLEKVVEATSVDLSTAPPKPTAAAPKRAKRPAPPPPKKKVTNANKAEQPSTEIGPSFISNGSPPTINKSDGTPELVSPVSMEDVPTNTSQSPSTQYIPSPTHTGSPVPVVSPQPVISPQPVVNTPPATSPELPATVSPAVSSQEPATSPLEPISPLGLDFSLQQSDLRPQEPAASNHEPATSSGHESTSVSPQDLSNPVESFNGPQEPAVTIPPEPTKDVFSSPPRRSPSPLQDSFLTSSLLRSDSPDLLTQMMAYSKNLASGLANMKESNGSPASSFPNSSYRPERTSQPDQQQKQPSTHFSKSLSKPNSDSNLKSNGPVAVVAPPITTKLIGSNSPDGGDISAGIKIQRVHKTRWTPRSSSLEPSPAQTPDQVGPSLTPQHYRQDTPSGVSHEDRSATLPNMRHHNARHKFSPSRDRRGQDQMTRGIGIAGGIGIGQDTKKGVPGQPRVNNPYQPRNLQQAWKSQEELRNQRVNPTVQKKATTPDGTKVLGVKPSNSFSQGPVDSRRNRSKTWSTQTVPDGYQVVYLLHPNNPYDLCSRCHQPLGQDNVLSMPTLRTQYHQKCFVCRVCKTSLGLGGAKTSKILVKNKQPHCKFCGSSDGNTLTTEC